MSSLHRVTTSVANWSQKTAFKHGARLFSAPAGASSASSSFSADNASGSASSKASQVMLSALTDDQILHLLKKNVIKSHSLEADLNDATRAVHIRRQFIASSLASTCAAEKTSTNPFDAMANIPVNAFDINTFYNSILNTNCEAVIGYIPYPVGVIGPLMLDGRAYRVPMATTEGALIASTNRGCTAIKAAGGATTVLQRDGMTRAPLVRMPTLKAADELRAWIEIPENKNIIASAFNSTSRFGRLRELKVTTAGRNVYLRFKAFTADAMGMNMITKGVNEALQVLKSHFPEMEVLALSGNLCTDKKPSAINWIDGRGKSVAAEVRLSGYVLHTVLKTTAQKMMELNTSKNLVGSALAGSIGGFNAHASNILTAIYLATGQDPAQNVESSNCLTLMEVDSTITDPIHDPTGAYGPGLNVSVNMPAIEVGTIGGGTSLPAQAACLNLLGVKGSDPDAPGRNAQQLARIVAGSVLAGELSLMAALTSNDLLNAHIKLNRKPSAAGENQQLGRVLSPAALSSLHDFTPAAVARAAHPQAQAQHNHHAAPGAPFAGVSSSNASFASSKRFFAATTSVRPSAFAAPTGVHTDAELAEEEEPRLVVP